MKRELVVTHGRPPIPPRPRLPLAAGGGAGSGRAAILPSCHPGRPPAPPPAALNQKRPPGSRAFFINPIATHLGRAGPNLVVRASLVGHQTGAGVSVRF